MSEVNIDSKWAFELYDLIYGRTVDSHSCPTYWKPSRDVFYELINNRNSYSYVWCSVDKLPEHYSGRVIAKIIKNGVPQICDIYFRDGHLLLEDYDCIVSYLMPKSQWDDELDEFNKKANWDDSKIADIVKRAKERAKNNTEKTKYYALFLGDIQLTEWCNNIDTVDEVKNGLKFKCEKTTKEIMISIRFE